MDFERFFSKDFLQSRFHNTLYIRKHLYIRKILKESINFNKRNYNFFGIQIFFLKKPYNRKLHVPFYYVYIPNHQ
jgi:hypothetical protein